MLDTMQINKGTELVIDYLTHHSLIQAKCFRAYLNNRKLTISGRTYWKRRGDVKRFLVDHLVNSAIYADDEFSGELTVAHIIDDGIDYRDMRSNMTFLVDTMIKQGALDIREEDL